ncbi:MAG: acetylornithine deacetylase [Proteobacteria bacterium]|nr:acetylornithine deacetylase [Pseudomonadota bacterium]
MIQRTLKILRDLIGFDTTSHLSNLALIEAIQLQFDALDIPYELSFNSNNSKASLFATIGDGSVPGLVLSGHTDVVPVDGQDWSSDPFKLREADAKVYGRGTCDMKGFIAVCLSMAETFKHADLPVPIHFAFSYDEEIGCLGVRDLIEELDKRPIKPLACIVGEPTNMRIVSAHKGMLDTVCTVQGCAGHSSLPDKGVNAIVAAARLVGKIQSVAEEIKRKGPFDERFTPPHSTLHVGKISGGTAVNIIPELCEFEFEIRNIPGQDSRQIANKIEDFAKETLLPDMQAVSSNSDIQWQVLAQFPGLDTPNAVPLNDWMKKVLNSDSLLGAVSYGTEAGLFSDIGIPTIVCGPGSINQAHRPDEFVEISEIEACLEFMQSLIEHLQKGKLPLQ